MSSDTESLTIGPKPDDSIHIIHEALRHRKEEIPLSYLMGVSGEAFRFFYNRQQLKKGMHTTFYNPLRAVSKALGFEHEMIYDDTFQAAWDRLQNNVQLGKTALIPLSDGCSFLIENDNPNTVVCQNGHRHEFSFDQLREKWQKLEGLLEMGLHGYYQFVLGNRPHRPKEREMALGTFRSASKLMKSRRKIRGCTMGISAYEELISHMQRIIDQQQDIEKRSEIAKWNKKLLLQCLEGRRAAVSYIEIVRKDFEGEELEHLERAVVAYRNVVKLLESLQTIFPSPKSVSAETYSNPTTNHSEGSQLTEQRFILKIPVFGKNWQTQAKQFKLSCKASIKLLKKLVKFEFDGVSALEDVVRVGEKLKM